MLRTRKEHRKHERIHKPPNIVYNITPSGSKKHAAAVGIPVKEEITAEPPVSNMAVTRILVKQPKTAKTM